MAGPYCARCQTAVILEQDGRSCSNCGTDLFPKKASTRGGAKEAREAHNLEAAGSNPAPATTYTNGTKPATPPKKRTKKARRSPPADAPKSVSKSKNRKR